MVLTAWLCQDCPPAREFAALGLPIVLVPDASSVHTGGQALLDAWLAAHCSAPLTDLAISRWLGDAPPLTVADAVAEAGAPAVAEAGAPSDSRPRATPKRCPAEVRLHVEGLGRDPATWPWSRAH